MPFRTQRLRLHYLWSDLKSHTGYIANSSEPRLPPGMRELLKEDLNKSFEF
jgi:hypothetical protein